MSPRVQLSQPDGTKIHSVPCEWLGAGGGKVTRCHIRSYCAFSIGNKKKEEAATVITARTLHQFHPRGCFPIVFFWTSPRRGLDCVV